MCNVKVVASKVPLTVGGNVHTTFGRKKSGEDLHFLACMQISTWRKSLKSQKSSYSKPQTQKKREFAGDITSGHGNSQFLKLTIK